MDMGKKLGRHDGIEEEIDEYTPSHHEGKGLMDGTDWDFLHPFDNNPSTFTLQEIFGPRSFLASRLLIGSDSKRTVLLKVVFGIS
jgi:hypothetical protein